MDWDEPQKQPVDHITLHGDLDAVSIDELKQRIAAMRSEIERCTRAIERKQNQLAAADAVFKT